MDSMNARLAADDDFMKTTDELFEAIRVSTELRILGLWIRGELLDRKINEINSRK